MDYIDDEGGKNNPNKIRRVLLLSDSYLFRILFTSVLFILLFSLVDY